jgi:hypothetical protein
VAEGRGKPASSTAGRGYWKVIMGNVKEGLAHSDGQAGDPPLLGRKSVLLGILTSGFVVANATSPSAASAASVRPHGTIKPIATTQNTYVSKWAPATAYPVGTQVITPNNDVVSAKVAHTSSSAYSTDVAKWTGSGTYGLACEAPVSVRQYGAVGNGTTLDTAAINAAIKANPGRTVYLPKAVYLIDAAANAGQRANRAGVQLNQPGTRLLMDQGTVLKVQPTASTRYAAIEITAVDCTVEGGNILGDVGSHIGTTGEWGYGISINSGANRSAVRGTRITRCWGDGIIIGDGDSSVTGDLPADIRITDVVCDDNRRQGLSAIASRRLRIIGGVFSNTGATAMTGPGAGIDFEPNPGMLQDNLDAELVGVVFSGNAGRGLVVQGNGRTNSVSVIGCRSVGNLDTGFMVVSATDRVKFLSCVSTDNALCGFSGDTASTSNEFIGCTAMSNHGIGFADSGKSNLYATCVARDNAKTGFYLDAAAVSPKLNACTSVGNCTGGTFLREIEVYAAGACLTACTVEPGGNATKATVGYGIRAGATGTVLTGCSALGTWAVSPYQGLADTFAFPKPGAPKPAAITAPPAPGTAYAQAEAVAMKSAVDSIRSALAAVGITA